MGSAKASSAQVVGSFSEESVYPYGQTQAEVQQLKFAVRQRELSEQAGHRVASGNQTTNRAANRASSRPVSNDQRRSEDAGRLLEHFKNNKKFWSSMQDLPLPNALTVSNTASGLHAAVDNSAVDNSLEIDPKTLRIVSDFLRSSVGPVGRNLRGSDRELQIVVMRGLAYLNHQLNQTTRDYAGFRTVWMLVWPVLWPILNELSLMPQNSGTLRAAMQKILAKSF